MNIPDTAAPYLDQASRLALAPVSPLVEIDDTPAPRDLSAAACGFVMPSRDAVRAHDARLMARDHYAPPAPIGDDEGDEETTASELHHNDTFADSEALVAWTVNKRRESLREHSFRLPSQGSRADVREAFRSMGVPFHD